MAVKRLCLGLLLVLSCPSWAKKHTCLTSASTCDECIQSGPECAWCTAPRPIVRCHTLRTLRRTVCGKDYMYYPQGSIQVVKNDSSTEAANAKTVFLQPQEFSLRLRPGVSQSFPLTVTMPTDRAITELTMDTSPVPVGVNITFSQITTGNPLVIEVNVEAARCPNDTDDSSQMQNRTGPWSVHITPRGFSLSMKLEITLQCQCDCTKDREEHSLECSGRGARVCGKCECYEPNDDKQCKTDIDSFVRGDEHCRSRPNAPLCSGRGKCVEGFCECEKPVNPEERYSGQFCECSNFDCPYIHNRMCGGHGQCECGRCVCDREWTGDECGCSMDTASCMAQNQMPCNGKGLCQCGICICQPPYAGPTCESCPTCIDKCQQHVACVECRAFGTGRKKDTCDQECGYLTVTMVETKDDVPQPSELCKMISRHDHCFFYYTVSNTPSGGHSTVVRAKDCPS